MYHAETITEGGAIGLFWKDDNLTEYPTLDSIKHAKGFLNNIIQLLDVFPDSQTFTHFCDCGCGFEITLSRENCLSLICELQIEIPKAWPS